LKKGMLLQCDPTVIYALEQQGRYKGTLSGKDLHEDSPYNTYMHSGLPPGPIGNPGEISLRAALAPADTQFLYFVANTRAAIFQRNAGTAQSERESLSTIARRAASRSTAG
jgi:UPF0755 protein